MDVKKVTKTFTVKLKSSEVDNIFKLNGIDKADYIFELIKLDKENIEGTHISIEPCALVKSKPYIVVEKVKSEKQIAQQAKIKEWCAEQKEAGKPNKITDYWIAHPKKVAEEV